MDNQNRLDGMLDLKHQERPSRRYGMRGYGFRIVIVGLAVLASACTTKMAAEWAGDSEKAPQGFAYSLPVAQFEIVTTRRLSGCPDLSGGDLEFIIETTATPRFAPGHTVIVAYDSMANAWKTSDFAVTLHDNGMLHTINAEADDRTAQVANNVVTGVGRLALLSAGVQSPATRNVQFLPKADPLKSLPTPPVRSCSPMASEHLARLDRLDGELIPQGTRVTAALRNAVEALEDFKAVRGELGDERSQDLVEKRRLLREAMESLQRLTAERQRVVDRISIQSTFVWPKDPNTREGPLTIPQREEAFIDAMYAGPRIENLRTMLALYAMLTPAIEPAPAAAPAPAPKTGSDTKDRDTAGETGATASGRLVPDPLDGVVYLTAAQGRLRVCRPGPPDNQGCEHAAPNDVLLEVWTNVPQFGRYAQLALKNGPFENNVLSATFRADGTLQQGRFEARRAAAESASSVFADAAGDALDVAGRIDAAETARKQARVAEAAAALERQRQELAVQAEIQRLQAQGGSVGELTLLQARQAVVDAQLTLERSERELRDFRTGGN